MTTVFCARKYGRFTEIQYSVTSEQIKPHRNNLGFNFLEGSFSTSENKRTQMQIIFENMLYLVMLYPVCNYSQDSKMTNSGKFRSFSWL